MEKWLRKVLFHSVPNEKKNIIYVEWLFGIEKKLEKIFKIIEIHFGEFFFFPLSSFFFNDQLFGCLARAYNDLVWCFFLIFGKQKLTGYSFFNNQNKMFENEQQKKWWMFWKILLSTKE